jgi:thermitase
MTNLSTCFLTALLLLAGIVHASESRYHPNHLFIKMKKGLPLVKSTLIKSSEKIIGNIYLVKTSSADLLATKLEGAQQVEYVQRDYYAGKEEMPKLEPVEPVLPKIKDLTKFSFTPFNDPEVSRLWGFEASAGLDVIGAYANLPYGTPEEVIVAVADTGVDHNHEDLKDVMWSNSGEIPGDGIDNDGNGYIDDIHGINVLVRDSNGNATMNTMASHWHGTHVSGTIAATQNNGVGIAGVASNVKIMAIRVVPDDSDELDSNIIEGFKYAANMGAKIINCSFGKKKNEGGMIVRDVMNEIGARYGVLMVVSAGNDSMAPWQYANNDKEPKYPASFDSANMLVIASSTSSGGLSSFSNIGKVTVDVASPGSSIYSTMPGDSYGMASGTSMAAPNASGVAAMVRGYFPHLSVAQVKEVLMSSVTKVSSLSNKMASGGRLNLKQALEKAATIQQ